MIDYNIISTGSKGNATVIYSAILIDCGVSFKALKDVCKGLKLVLLTHVHTDHFNKATIKRLAEERPTLRFGCGEWLVDPLLKCGVNEENIDVYTMGYCFTYTGLCTVKAESIPHDVSNCCYHIQRNNTSVLYATDTGDISHINAAHYDLYLVEANHTEEGIQERIQAKIDAGEYVYEYAAMQNHLSKEKCDTWLLDNMGDKSEYIYMHRHVD